MDLGKIIFITNCRDIVLGLYYKLKEWRANFEFERVLASL